MPAKYPQYVVECSDLCGLSFLYATVLASDLSLRYFPAVLQAKLCMHGGGMDVSVCFGIFMLGAATGALLSRIAISGQLRRLRDELGICQRDTTRA